MRKLALGFLVLALASPLAAATWKSVPLMDGHCSEKADVMAHPEKHSRSCAMQCSKAGYGAVIDGKYVSFDANGNKLVAEALKSSDKKDHLNVTVTGDMKDGVIAVSSLKLE